MTVYNFAAGPATLPTSVIKQVQQELPSLNNSGMSIMEISHRSKMFVDILNTAKEDLRQLLSLPHNYHILFFQGGGTGQFAAVPLNLANKHKKIALLDSGHWAIKAEEEAKKLGVKVDILSSSRNDHYHKLPYYKNFTSLKKYDYLHITTNNTIEGTAFHKLPKPKDAILVGDLSSNFMAEKYNPSQFGLMYAGAQKNLGPAGVTIVIVRNDLVKPVEKIPSILNYNLFVKKNSMSNTPPVFAIYVVGLVLKWMKKQGGISEIEKRNIKKSSLLYNFLDNSKFFSNKVKKSDRSLTNIPFSSGKESLDKRIIEEASKNGLMNLKGHRSVGGLRASLYDAMPVEGVKALVNFLEKFEKENRGFLDVSN